MTEYVAQKSEGVFTITNPVTLWGCRGSTRIVATVAVLYLGQNSLREPWFEFRVFLRLDRLPAQAIGPNLSSHSLIAGGKRFLPF